MGEIVVKGNVRYTKKDANRVDVVTAGDAVQTKVAVEDTDAWAREQADAARAELQAELDQKRADAEAEIAKLRADFEAELEQRRADAEKAPATDDSIETPPTGEEVAVMSDTTAAEAVTEETTEEATKVVEPEVKKVREPSTTKSRTSGSK